MRQAMLSAAAAVMLTGAQPVLAGDVAAGQKRYAVNCVNCHGKTGKGMASFPALTGRSADYIAGRLTTYRAREMVGPNSAIMMSLAADLSDSDIADLASYISTSFP